MAHITRQRMGEMLRRLFEILLQHPEGTQAKLALERLAQELTLTEYEQGQYESGRRFEKIVRFATVDAVKAGWMRKDKGRWSVTEEGKVAYQRIRDPEAFQREAARLYAEWRRSQPDESSSEVEINDELTTGREATRTFEEAEEQAWEEIWRFLEKIPPYDFQDMVAALLEAMGYHVAWIAPPGKDRGIDIIAYTDPLGTKPPRIKVQVKRRADNIDVGELRSFLAVLGEGDVGLFFTTGSFTRDASDEARTQSSRMVTLVDRERFAELWIEYFDKLSEEGRSHLPLRKIYFLAPQD